MTDRTWRPKCPRCGEAGAVEEHRETLDEDCDDVLVATHQCTRCKVAFRVTPPARSALETA